MNSRAERLSRHYAASLHGFLLLQQETLLQQAYDLGRKAIAGGLGLLDMARVHQQALASCLVPPLSAEEKTRTLKAAETFFMEALSPFEAAHRGFREANPRLRQLNEALEHRNVELAAMNRELERSEEHYRQLFQQAGLMEENLRSLSNRLLHVQEEERRRISRELHDQVGQALTLISLNLEMLRGNGQLDGKLLKKRIADTQDLLAKTRETVHGFARELRPAMLDELGLLPALRCYLKSFAERTGLRVRFNGVTAAEQLNAEQKTVLYRVAQEALMNVAKHAHASRVNVSLRTLKNGVQMQVKDNGKGFRADRLLSADAKKRLGLLGMAERVRLVRGQCAVTSERRKGTTVLVEIPLKILNPD